MKLSLVIEAIDKASANVKRITGNVRNLGTSGMGVVQRATQGANRELGRFGQSVPGRLRAMASAAARFAGRAGLKGIEISARGAGWAVGKLLRTGGELALGLAKWGAAAGAFAMGVGIKSIIETGAQFEDFQAVLEGTEGSAAKAKAALAWVQKFAKDKPYELAEVTDAFVRARGVGIDPMNGSFKAMGDAASGARKEIMDAVEAVADAQTGEFERLKSFNITTAVAGEKVTFSYLDKAGKNMSRTVGKNMRDIQHAVLEIFGEKYADGMIRRSRTLSGIWANIKDSGKGFLKKIADSGVFEWVKGKLQNLLDWLDAKEADGSLDRWAKNISDWLVNIGDEAIRFAKETNWEEVGGHLKNIGKLIWWIVKGLSSMVSLASRLAGLKNNVPGWLRPTLNVLPGSQVGAIANMAYGAVNGSRGAPPSPPTPPAAGRASNRQHQPIKPRAGGGSSASAVQVGGRLEIELKGSGARDAHVRAVRSANNDVPISVRTNRGRAMEAPA